MIRKVKYIKSKAIYFVFIAAYIISTLGTGSLFAAQSAEKPEASYNGIDNTEVILNNIDYNDVRNSDTWAKEAIYESGVMDIMKGFGDRSFGMKDTLTKEQAMAIAYRIAGREGEAQKLAENLDSAKKADEKKTSALSMWADGYLQLGANEGLISQQDLKDAFNADQVSIESGGFYREAPAQRQEVAEWVARTLKLAPVYGQQDIFNSFSDWKNAKPSRIPYIEAVLKSKIMNGYNGYFEPTKSITRQEMAQIVKNAENFILPTRGLTKKSGAVESITGVDNYTSGDNLMETVFNLRGPDGKLYNINVNYLNASPSTRNEISGERSQNSENEFIVFKDGNIGKSTLLNNGDRIEYFVTKDGKVLYARTIPGQSDTVYVVGKVVENVPVASSFKIIEINRSDYKDTNLLRNARNISVDGNSIVTKFNLSGNVFVSIDDKKANLEDILSDYIVMLKVENNLVNEIIVENPKVEIQSQKGVYSGIVEDNNPKLGYISLIGSQEFGSGRDFSIKTFTYVRKESISIEKNHEPSGIESIEPGDTAFVGMDDAGKIVSISAVDNLDVKYGEIISKKDNSIIVRYGDGTQQALETNSGIPVLSDGHSISYDNLKDGDSVKLLLKDKGNDVSIKEISVKGKEHFITDIYKGRIANIDRLNGKISLQNQGLMERGKFIKTDNKGVLQLKFGDDLKVYSKDKVIDIASENAAILGNDAYLAVEKDYGGEERVVLVSLRDELDTEVLYDDSVSKAVDGSKEFKLSKLYDNINYGNGSIIVKDGRLVTGNSISEDDLAYVVANREYEKGNYYADVVQINQRPGINNYHIYRGRISNINENENFTIKSFSELNGYKWEFTNTMKTFDITPDTLFKDETGIIGTRNFVGTGDGSYMDKTVYIVSRDGVNADYISNAAHVETNAKGKIYKLTVDSATGIPTGITLKEAKIFDSANRLWKSNNDMTLNIPVNAIIIKGDKLIKPSELKLRDQVRAIKKDDTLTGDAVIIIVEG